MKIKPLGERVLIKTIKNQEERTRSGLIIPKSKEEKKEGIVIAVGNNPNGTPLPLKEGDHVLYGGYSNEEIEINNEKHLILEYKDIVAKIIE
jgi:chaperonin GroES